MHQTYSIVSYNSGIFIPDMHSTMEDHMRGVVTSQNMTTTTTTTAMTSGPIPATMSRALKLVLMNAMMRNQRGTEDFIV